LISILLGLTSALSWGAADFTGGLATRKIGAYRAVFYGEIVGILFIVPITLSVREPLPGLSSWIYSILAGSLGTLGLLLLYYSLAQGTMSIAAPVSALMAAILPVIVGSFTEGLPGFVTFLGFAFALAAVWLVSQDDTGLKDILSHLSGVRLPLLAGIGFGIYFVLMHVATRHSTFWPMVISRSAGLAVISLFILFRKETWHLQRNAWGIVTINGILDVGGNAFFILAGQTGRFDIAAVVSSLYPGATVMLAALLLKERISRIQWFGIISALIAIILFTL